MKYPQNKILQETQNQDYSNYLQKKYLPFRDQYLNYFYYPKIAPFFEENKDELIVDLGCGLGSFLRFAKKKKRMSKGFDTNPDMVERCKKEGLDVHLGSIVEFPETNVKYAFCDNVLEHLEIEEIDLFFQHTKKNIQVGGCLVIIVPGKKGFEKDYTHKTFVDKAMIEGFCAKYNLRLQNSFYLPFNYAFISKVLYLNMCAFVIEY